MPGSLTSPAVEKEPVTPVYWPDNISQEMLLGKQLFFDPELSARRDISCANCHDFSHGGSTPVPRPVNSQGEQTRYNSPSVFNLNSHYLLGWEGQFTDMQAQLNDLIGIKQEMGLDWPTLLSRLDTSPVYPQAFRKVYPDGISRNNIIRAISAFQMALTTPSPFDAYLQGDKQAISNAARQGYSLFKRYGCSACHQGQAIGANLLQKIGVIKPYAQSAGDAGRFNTTGKHNDLQVYRVPSLRNVAETAPYFHNGSVSNLETAVITMGWHQLGRHIPGNDVQLIIAFLQSLSGTPHPELLP